MVFASRGCLGGLIEALLGNLSFIFCFVPALLFVPVKLFLRRRTFLYDARRHHRRKRKWGTARLAEQLHCDAERRIDIGVLLCSHAPFPYSLASGRRGQPRSIISTSAGVVSARGMSTASTTRARAQVPPFHQAKSGTTLPKGATVKRRGAVPRVISYWLRQGAHAAAGDILPPLPSLVFRPPGEQLRQPACIAWVLLLLSEGGRTVCAAPVPLSSAQWARAAR